MADMKADLVFGCALVYGWPISEQTLSSDGPWYMDGHHRYSFKTIPRQDHRQLPDNSDEQNLKTLNSTPTTRAHTLTHMHTCTDPE